MAGLVDIVWDDRAKALIENFQNARPYWKRFIDQLSFRLGKESMDHMRPMMQAKAVWNGQTHGTGNLQRSLSADIKAVGGGFQISFNGLFYGNYMDVGNMPPGAVFARQNGKGFPIGKRGGEDPSNWTWSKTFHGMGHRTPDVPTHFSEKTAEYLDANMHEFADAYLQELLESMVNV